MLNFKYSKGVLSLAIEIIFFKYKMPPYSKHILLGTNMI